MPKINSKKNSALDVSEEQEALSVYKKLSRERKKLQGTGELPDFVSTAGWQLLKAKYLSEGESFKDRLKSIARTAAQHTNDPEHWRRKFFEVLWNGWLCCSTPVLANMGTNKGMPVSCSGCYVEDSIDGIFNTKHETALLTKYGFGTSAYLGDVRPRGTEICSGGTAGSVSTWFKSFAKDMSDVTQGVARRGAWAGYIPIQHGDFDEILDTVKNDPHGINLGINIDSDFIDSLNKGDKESLRRWKRLLELRMITGKGYMYFVDKVHKQQPEMYKALGLRSKASNLCTEITLHSDEDETYTCVLSSLNLSKYYEWKGTDTVQVAIRFLDCVAEEFIQKSKGIRGLEKALLSTIKSRALGLGALGFHSLLQRQRIAFDSLQAMYLNNEIFTCIQQEAKEASRQLAKEFGEPEYCKGFGFRNTHLTAIAPNMSSALIYGGVSQGIEPFISNVWVQASAGGTMMRINPEFLDLMKERGKYSDELVGDLAKNYHGSVQHLDWLTDEEKTIFKTAYEIDQRVIVRLASQRQKHVCQAQSLNLFFSADESEEYVSKVHQLAVVDKNIKSLYYCRSQAGVKASSGECSACEG